MKFHQILAATLCTGTLLTLQGCGGSDDGGGGDSKTTTTTSSGNHPGTTTMTSATTTSATMTTTVAPRSPALTGDEAVEYLNSNYKGWKDGDTESSVGVVMRTTGEWGFFCQGFKAYAGCFNGFARCITSASILNHHVMLNKGDQLFMGMKRSTGIMFNTSLVETKLGRCTYQYDGTTWGRYNRGCGGTSLSIGNMTDCNDTTSAWFDIDPLTGQETTDISSVVLKDYCPTRAKAGSSPTRKGDSPCYWKGPAWSKTGDSESETHKMMSQRFKNQGHNGDQLSTWDEVVIDAELLLPELHRDPARVVLAIAYDNDGDESKTAAAKRTANNMAKDMQAEFDMDQPVPVVGVDTKLHVYAQPDVPGPFFYGKRWSTQTTTTSTRSGPACCFGGCSGNNCDDGDFCPLSKANCDTCQGTWCTSQSMAI